MKLSARARDIQESPIRKLAAVAQKTKSRGVGVYHLNIGQPDIPTPEAFYDNIRDSFERVLSYGPSDGIAELKEAMISYFRNYGISLSKENIVITTGGSEAISFAFNAIADPGDEIIVPEPFYTNYNGFATLAGVQIIPVTTQPENGYHLANISEIESKITPRTRGILINSPNNPTGTVFTESEIQQLAELAKRRNLFLLADEVYKEFTYDGETHYSLLQLKEMEDRVIVMDSISKRYSSCGARVGAVLCRNLDVMQGVMKFAQARLCPPTLEQIGAIGAYRLPMTYFDDIILEYQKRRDLLYDILIASGEILLQKPKGAFYVMARLPVTDSDHFARWLLEEFQIDNETVMVSPGAGFYSTPGAGKQEVRIAYVLDTTKLSKACGILVEALRAYNR